MQIPPTILIIEDEFIISMHLKLLLGSWGLNVIGIAESCEAATANVLEQVPDLIISDIRIVGDIDGIDTVERILELDIPKPYIIFLTANSDERNKDRILKICGVNTPILPKPINEENLIKTIEKALTRK